jgi:mannose-6-phosphate isomerase-like protein (cupin superfamily)
VTDFSRTTDAQVREFLLGRGQRATILTTAAESDGRFDLVEGHKDPGTMSPLHLHRRYEERFWVASGELAVWVGEDHLVLGSGDYACVPVGVPHAFRAGVDGCHVLTISSPAGFAELVARGGTPRAPAGDAADGGPDAGGDELDLVRLMTVCDDIGDVLLGTPGTLPADLTAEHVQAALDAARQREARATGTAGGTR